MISGSFGIFSFRSKKNQKFTMRLASRAVKSDELLWKPLTKESSDFGWECCCICPSSYSLAAVVSVLIRLFHYRISAALAVGDKKFSADRNLLKIPILLSKDLFNQLQLRLSLIDSACKLGKVVALLKKSVF